MDENKFYITFLSVARDYEDLLPDELYKSIYMSNTFNEILPNALKEKYNKDIIVIYNKILSDKRLSHISIE